MIAKQIFFCRNNILNANLFVRNLILKWFRTGRKFLLYSQLSIRQEAGNLVQTAKGCRSTVTAAIQAEGIFSGKYFTEKEIP